MPFESIGRDDHVDHAGLVFESEKGEPLGGAGALTTDDEPSHGHCLSIAPILLGLT